MTLLLRELLLLLVSTRASDAFAYSCEEVKYRLVNTSFSLTTFEVCVVAQENFTNWATLDHVYVHGRSFGQPFNFSFHLLATLNGVKGGCATTEQSEQATTWSIVIDSGYVLDCGQEFTVYFTNDKWGGMPVPLKEEQVCVDITHYPFIVPLAGMYIRQMECVGTGDVTFYTGVGIGESEERYRLVSWPCESMPSYVYFFGNAITIETDPTLKIQAIFSSDIDKTLVLPLTGLKIAIITSGRSDDQQNLAGGDYRVKIDGGDPISDVTVQMQLTFDPSNTGSIALQKTRDGSLSDFRNGTYTEQFSTNYFEVRYVPKGKQPSEIWNSQDNMLIEISIAANAPPTKPKDPYCNCDVDKFGFPIGWSYNDIWLDIVVIIDTTDAMGKSAVDEAATLVESFVSDGINDFLVTNALEPFYTRIGVISMSDTAEFLYNLNLTKADKVHGRVVYKEGVKEIDVLDAFTAAMNMLNEGLTHRPDRATTRQVIYYLTNSDPHSVDMTSLNNFKATKGAIIVNDFKGGPSDGLTALASTGYSYASNSYMDELQMFCKANCFCDPAKATLGGTDPAIQAAGGCYQLSAASVPFNRAKSTCADYGGIIATIHDKEKGRFLYDMMPRKTTQSDYFWIGYEKTSDGAWQWEDESTDAYTNWAKDEPSPAAVANCAYADTTSTDLLWGAGNCQIGFPFVCQYPPCSVGFKNCF